MKNLEVGERIRQLREEKGLSRAKLAELVGVTQGHINNIERGDRSPSTDLLKIIAKVLGVPVKDVLQWLNDDVDQGLKQIEDEKIRVWFSADNINKLSPATVRAIVSIIRDELNRQEGD